MTNDAATRVGLVIGQLTRGGAEGQLVLLARQLDPRRFVPRVYCLSAASEPYGAELKAQGIPVTVFRGSAVARMRAFASALDEDRIEIVHSWLFLANAAAGLASVRFPHLRLITSARNRKVQGRLNWWLNRLAFHRSRAIVVNSVDVATYIREAYGAPPQRIRTIFNGIDTTRFRPAAEYAKHGAIVTIGRLVEQKNHELFLQCAARLANEFPWLRFVIVGGGPLETMLRRRAEELGVADHVTFAGERSDVDNILREASLFWLTSRWEGMPNVVLEALASGVPAIVTDVGGARELIRSAQTGFVVASGDAEGFVGHTRELLRDDERQRRFSIAARLAAQEFSVGKMVERMESVYDEVRR